MLGSALSKHSVDGQGPKRFGYRAMRRGRRTLFGIVTVLGASLLLVACSTTVAPMSDRSSTSRSVSQDVASYSLLVGDTYSWIFPLYNQANAEPWDINPDAGMWRPLYYAATPGRTGISEDLSIAEPPIYSDGDTTVTVRLKRGWVWSDGAPVTTSDVRFYFELEAAGARLKLFSGYVPGLLPDDVKSVTYQGPYQFTMHLIHRYNPAWFSGNQLTWIVPLPRQVWDKTCSTCSIGHDASSVAGADKVYKFLYAASSQLSTYSTNPLWKTVDGPWVMKSFDPATYHVVFSANRHYSGPGRPHLAGYSIYSFSSETAELDAVRSGTVDFGYLPFSDTGESSYLKSHGFTITPWKDFYNEAMEFGYTGPWKALVDQLYIRQALQHLVDEPLYIQRTLDGFGVPDYGVAPDYPGSDLVAPALRHDPYPFDVAAARNLLRSHGWTPGRHAIDECERPGTGPTECGAGIPRGKQLSLLFMYSVGSSSFTAQVEAFQSAAAEAGVGISLDGQTVNSMFSIAGVCPPGPCKYAIAGYGDFLWDFGQGQTIPSGGEQFGSGNYWAGGYDSATANRLIAAAHTSPGLGSLYADETYLSKDVASLWWPLYDYDIALVTNRLKGWAPLNPYGNYHPSSWYFTKGS